MIGPNGAGKTTLFNAITATVDVAAGDIVFEGTSLLGLDPNRVTARGIARTFQNVRLFANMTVLENVMVSQHCRTRQHAFGALFYTPSFRREETEIPRASREGPQFLRLPARRVSLRPARLHPVLRQPAAASRSPGPWPPSPS